MPCAAALHLRRIADAKIYATVVVRHALATSIIIFHATP